MIYLADRIFDGYEWRNEALWTEAGTVTAFVPPDALPEGVPVRRLNGAIVPAFLDLQVYGAGGRLFAAYPDVESLRVLEAECRRGGAALALPTVATNTPDVVRDCLHAFRAYKEAGGSFLPGLHLEGPWIHPKRRGAHIEACIHPPTLDEVTSLLSEGRGLIRMITLAPERCDRALIHLLLQEGIVLSAGHSDATFEEASAAFDGGIGAVTHLYNAMSPLQHRAPGLVGAAFLHPSVRASIIPDGLHVSWEAVRIAKKQMGERLFAITDAVTETGIGAYPHTLNVDHYTSGGTLSGSALTMHAAFFNLVHRAGIAPEEALRMCGRYPAEVLGVGQERGVLAPGSRADLLLLDETWNLVEVLSPDAV
ncbi:N-acetylglucosamine-6-phosphate deacetylase [Flaviaesturariibacter amylovorans]|uniref:N-acetylglucosamine-6-phosphate deacetylase n=1 Tax=Flaviaesturariibacter amylovorans TaxID=1084520 RepID=A0ABP8HH50_9BACT